MSIGRTVRRLLGPLEIPVANLYRALFFNLDQFVDVVRSSVPAKKILELGCGEGSVTGLISRRYPEATITGIDISDRAGRLFWGDRERVTFQTQSIQEFAAEHAEEYDLVIICDVMHHIPWDEHVEILSCARKTLKPSGQLVLKEWENLGNLINAVSLFAELYITGDDVRYGVADDWRNLLHKVFGPNSIQQETHFGPWRNNIAFLVQA